MTRADHQSGSDRIFEALQRLDPDARGRHRRQRAGRPADHRAGDHPRRAGAARRTRRSTSPRSASRSSATRKRPIPNVVKIVGSPLSATAGCGRSISPAPPRRAGEGPLYHHVGLYAYRRAALERFVVAAAVAAGTAREAGAAARARGRHAHRRRDRRARCRSASTRPTISNAPAQILSTDESLGSDHACQDQQDRLPGRAGRQFRHRLPQHVSRRWSRCPARPSRTPSTRSRPARPTSP